MTLKNIKINSCSLLTIDKIEYRTVIKSVCLKGISPTKTKGELYSVYENASSSFSIVISTKNVPDFQK